jgi:peptidoglycan/LPS O-acetylase OafA/YrhL
MLSRSSLKAPVFATLLGGASYSIYLLNRDIGYTIPRVLRRAGLSMWLDTWTMFAVSVAVATVAGLALHILYEKPVLRWINARTVGRRAS